MSEEIKFEVVFGDQSLFDGAPEDAVVAVGYGGNKICYFSEQYKSAGVLFSSETSMAMRRIIKTPVWTVADQKAGRLPEVGCSAVFMLNDGVIPEGNIYNWENGDEIEILKVFSGAVACVYNKSKKWAANISMTSIKPIETPEERARRLKKEWCHYQFEAFDARIPIPALEIIYDALLSGDLQVPTKGK